MRATAAAERLRRALADLSVRFTRALQPTAEALGQGLQLSNDAIQLFSEEAKSPLSSCSNFPYSLNSISTSKCHVSETCLLVALIVQSIEVG